MVIGPLVSEPFGAFVYTYISTAGQILAACIETARIYLFPAHC